jgi:hypothetical protein
MESKSVKLAKKIVTLLHNEDYQEAMSALKIVKILLPTPADRRKEQKQKEDQEDQSTAGSLVPADEELMSFSKAMGRSMPASEPEKEPELQ